MIKKHDYSDYPDIYKYSTQEDVEPHLLIKAYEIEKEYHKLLIGEKDKVQRSQYYNDLYSKVLPIYNRNPNHDIGYNRKDKYVKLFKKELENKRIVDFGCGSGNMLMAAERLIQTKSLVGVDVVIDDSLKSHDKIKFIESNIIDFKLEQEYDIAFSDNVIEHLVEEDAISHIRSIYNGLAKGGKFIVIMPNQLFSPWDITRIKDFSQSGKIKAHGGHVNESTHSRMNEILSSVGFTQISTILPIPKIKYSILKNIRMNTRYIESLERNKAFLSLLKLVKFRGECLLKFPVTLIAQK